LRSPPTAAPPARLRTFVNRFRPSSTTGVACCGRPVCPLHDRHGRRRPPRGHRSTNQDSTSSRTAYRARNLPRLAMSSHYYCRSRRLPEDSVVPFLRAALADHHPLAVDPRWQTVGNGQPSIIPTVCLHAGRFGTRGQRLSLWKVPSASRCSDIPTDRPAKPPSSMPVPTGEIGRLREKSVMPAALLERAICGIRARDSPVQDRGARCTSCPIRSSVPLDGALSKSADFASRNRHRRRGFWQGGPLVYRSSGTLTVLSTATTADHRVPNLPACRHTVGMIEVGRCQRFAIVGLLPSGW